MREHIENQLSLEPDFRVIDTFPEGETDAEKRYVVFDAEMTPICSCDDAKRAGVIRDLFTMATGPNLERAGWARLMKAERACLKDAVHQGSPEVVGWDAAAQALRDLGADVDSLLKPSAPAASQ
jgi:hypothetical protein